MDENTNQAVETVEESVDELDAAFDEEWGETPAEDDDFNFDDDSADESSDAQPEETEAAEETQTEPESSDDSAAEEPEPDHDSNGWGEGQDQSFTIKVNGEDRQVTLAEMTELAQKGSDYDRVKQERDTFKQDAPTIQKYKGYEAFLKELADSSGIEIEALIENTRARLLMNEAEAKGEELSEEEAVRQARQKAKESAPKEPAPEPTPEETEEQKRNKAFAAFVAEYPSVDPKTIPKEVWSEFGRTSNLVDSYRKYEIKKLRSENEQLKQNQKNKERSTGSRRTAGATTPKDAFDEVWDD